MSDTNGIKAVNVAKDSKKSYVTKAPGRIIGSSLKPLDWLTDYKDPIRFSGEKELEQLLYEVSKHELVSSIVIKANAPICLLIKDKGLYAISHRVIDLIEAEQLVKLLTTNDLILSEIRNGNLIAGITKPLGKHVKTRYRYEVTACASAKNEDAFSVAIRPLPID